VKTFKLYPSNPETSDMRLPGLGGLPVRFKILLLIVAALAASLSAYLYVGTTLIVEDKVSYIYDYTLAEVKAAADKIDSRLQRIGSLGRVTTVATTFWDSQSKELGLTGAVLLRPAGNDRFVLDRSLGDAATLSQTYIAHVAQLGWTPQTFEKDAFLVGAPVPGEGGTSRIPVGVRSTDAEGKPVAFFTLTQLDAELVKEGGKNYELKLVDGAGNSLLTRPAAEGALPAQAFDAFNRNLNGGTFDSGVRDWSFGGREYIGGYQRLASQKLTVTSLISKETAFLAAKQLITRSLVLGLSILFLATGATLLSVRSLTRRLRELWQATQKVAEGDFTIRVDTKNSGDEVGGLAKSFNTMTDKIQELMIHTAQKARMEKELETAQAVQARFFPAKGFEHPSMRLSGRYLPVSECAGDWWHYSQIGPQLIVVVGDVTGHGVSAALVTAAAHTAFSLLTSQFLGRFKNGTMPEGVPIDELIRSLNLAVLAAGSGQSTMTFVISIVNLETGKMVMSNASHPPMYIYRRPLSMQNDENPLPNFKSLMDGRIASLGEKAEIEIDTHTEQLKPGDILFWYTDGILEARPSDGAKLGKKDFLRLLAHHSQGAVSDARGACDGIMGDMTTFFNDGTERPDDITLIVARIPVSARFVQSPDATRGNIALMAG
jgi:sigma-B regulation protein RsbU (phosphoserine phosphatase)